MKALLCRAFGPVVDLVVEEVADPQAGPGEVVVGNLGQSHSERTPHQHGRADQLFKKRAACRPD